MQFWEHEALTRRSGESHAPRIPREGVAISSPLVVAAPWSHFTHPARYRNLVAAASSATHVANSPPGRPGSTEEAPHAPVKAASASSVLGHSHQAAAIGSTTKHRRWNATTSTAQMAIVEAAARKAGSLDKFRGPPALPLSPSFPPSPSPEVRKRSMWWRAQGEMKFNLGLSGLDQLKRSRFVLLVVSALGSGCGTKPKFMMDDCFGLAMKALDLGLGWSPDLVHVDERLHAHPSKRSKV